jgi:hypothetical protein
MPVKVKTGRPKASPKTLTLQSQKGSPSAVSRWRYVLHFLQHGCVAGACKASGLSHRAHKRIIQMIAQTCSLDDAPRSGRASTYTEQGMAAAYKHLAGADKRLTGLELLAELKELGDIHETAHIDAFMRHLHLYVRSRGEYLSTNSTKTTFFISESDKVQRLEFAKSMLAWLDAHKSPEQALERLVFSDESTFEERPHPKGAWLCVIMQLWTPATSQPSLSHLDHTSMTLECGRRCWYATRYMV